MKPFFVKLVYDIVFETGKRIPRSRFGRWWFDNLTTPLYEIYWRVK